MHRIGKSRAPVEGDFVGGVKDFCHKTVYLLSIDDKSDKQNLSDKEVEELPQFVSE